MDKPQGSNPAWPRPARDCTGLFLRAGCPPLPCGSEIELSFMYRVSLHVMELDDGRLHVMLEAGEDATHADLARAISLTLKWRDYILRYQGPWLGDGWTLLLHDLDESQRAGRSYAQLAERVNADIVELLQRHLVFDRAFQAAKPTFKTTENWEAWLDTWPEADYTAFDFAYWLLVTLGMPARDIDAYLQAALAELQAGRPAFLPGEPVSPQRIKEKLKTWRRSKKGRALVGQKVTDSAPMQEA